jgi:hypothetical protein
LRKTPRTVNVSAEGASLFRLSSAYRDGNPEVRLD